MKRSEMVDKLVNHFDTLLRGQKTYKELASDIIYFLEDEGMEPPRLIYWNSPNPRDVDENGIPKVLNTSMDNGEYRNYWEKE